MADDEHLNLLQKGPEIWNEWRNANPTIVPDLSSSDLRKVSFEPRYKSNESVPFNLSHANLRSSKFYGCMFPDVDFHASDLSHSNFVEASFHYSNLIGSNLTSARLDGATFAHCDMRHANLSTCSAYETNFSDSYLDSADFEGMKLEGAMFPANDLSNVLGLENIQVGSFAVMGLETIFNSRGKIPESFYLACGATDTLISFIPSLIGSMTGIQFYSCFISYSSKDEDFAQRLHSRMRSEGLRVWFAPEDMKGGRKTYDQIDEAIRHFDKLLVVLSERSMSSNWVTTEIRRARKREEESGQRKLFPIRLTDFSTLKDWQCFDSDSGHDLAQEVREYHIPDFSNWKDHDSFEAAFARLLKDLKTS